MCSNSTSVLIVEDNAIIALDAEEAVLSLGMTVAGVASRVSEALEAIRVGRVDVAVLDYELADGTSEPVARKLAAAGIPYAIVSSMPLDILLERGLDPLRIVAKPADFARIVSCLTSSQSMA